MSSNIFLKDNRFNSPEVSKKIRIKRTLKIAFFILLFAIICSLTAIGINIFLSSNVDKTYNSFVSYCNSNDYDKALEIYRDTQENVLTKSFFNINKEKKKNILLKMEEQVDKLITAPFNNLVSNKTTLSNSNIDLIERFLELSNRKYAVLLTSYLEDFISGKVKKDNVVFTLTELNNIDSLKETTSRYLSEIDEMNSFIPSMIEINNDLKTTKYLKAAIKLNKELPKQTGFLKTFLTKVFLNTKKTMYNPVLSDIDVMMSAGKYYSAKTLIESTLTIFNNDLKLKSKLEICKTKTTKKLVEYYKPVEHLSFRPLISNTSLAFDGDSYAKNANDLMVTAYEFKKIIEQLYKNNYILIDMDSLVDSYGKKNRLFIPENKIPVIISVEGLNYYAGRLHSGNSDNLILDKDGFVASSYTNASGDKVIDRNGEIVGILEQFIDKNPDFSFDGAKGTISLTGYECIFGYVVNEDQVDDRTKAFADNNLEPFSISAEEIKSNKEKVIAIIKKLKQTGWTFASSSYGSIIFTNSSLEQIKNDTGKFKSQVESLTGKVKSLFFPNGYFVTSKEEKGLYLINNGYYIQCGIGPYAYFSFSENHLYMDRITVNGITLKFINLSRFFDVSQIYDPARKILLKTK